MLWGAALHLTLNLTFRFSSARLTFCYRQLEMHWPRFGATKLPNTVNIFGFSYFFCIFYFVIFLFASQRGRACHREAGCSNNWCATEANYVACNAYIPVGAAQKPFKNASLHTHCSEFSLCFFLICLNKKRSAARMPTFGGFHFGFLYDVHRSTWDWKLKTENKTQPKTQIEM